MTRSCYPMSCRMENSPGVRDGRFESEISLGRGEEWVSGASVLSILRLAATQGTVLSVRAVGADAEQAVMEVGALIEAPDES